jgi:pimeloyl-ACP methyl ester carboxylesterase
MTHGWPGSVVELLKTIGPLTDPAGHGGRAEDAFHLVLPSIPGYGFSDEPTELGWGPIRIGLAWADLMRRLGYTRYVAQGRLLTVAHGAGREEPGSAIAAQVGHDHPVAGCGQGRGDLGVAVDVVGPAVEQ